MSEDSEEEFDLEALLATFSASVSAKTPERDDTTAETREAMLDLVIEHYLDSPDFNGLPIGASTNPHTFLEALIRDGLVQLVTDREYPNTHIKPWSDERVEQQIERLDQVATGELSGCLYPTSSALNGRDRSAYAGRPYSAAMAAGAGALELAFFRVDAIEQYRNDPRYHFDYEDFGVTFGIADEAYLSDDEPETDKIHTMRAGFAYDTQGLSTDAQNLVTGDRIHRFICVFHCDLAELTPTHQARLKTWEHDKGNVRPHPVRWAMQMGEWPDRVGPFDKILAEMTALNELWELHFKKPLFATVERPREWGWVLRPSTNEWNNFILLTDKLLSENIQNDGLTAAGAPKKDESGQGLGTLSRLQRLLVLKTSASEQNIREVLQSFRDVRKERQTPAHTISSSLTDHTVVARQRDLLFEIADSLGALRRIFGRTSVARTAGWSAPDYLDSEWWVI